MEIYAGENFGGWYPEIEYNNTKNNGLQLTNTVGKRQEACNNRVRVPSVPTHLLPQVRAVTYTVLQSSQYLIRLIPILVLRVLYFFKPPHVLEYT